MIIKWSKRSLASDGYSVSDYRSELDDIVLFSSARQWPPHMLLRCRPVDCFLVDPRWFRLRNRRGMTQECLRSQRRDVLLYAPPQKRNAPSGQIGLIHQPRKRQVGERCSLIPEQPVVEDHPG